MVSSFCYCAIFINYKLDRQFSIEETGSSDSPIVVNNYYDRLSHTSDY